MRAPTRCLVVGCLLILSLNLAPTILPAANAAGLEVATSEPVLDEAGVLALAKRRFTEFSGQIEPQFAGEYARLVGVPPRFDPAYVNRAKAEELSNAATAAILSPDTQHLAIALGAAAVGHAPRLPVAAHNLAAALYLRQQQAGFAVEIDTSAARDAVSLYRYALSLDPGRLQTWVNLGNVLVDLKRLEEARACFAAALKQDPGLLEAHVGMATYWFAKGDKDKARAELQSTEIRFPASTRKISQRNDRLQDPEVAPQVSPDDGIETMEEKLRKLRELKPMSTADIIEEWDPVDAQQIRIRVNNLPKTDQLLMPSLTSITMFGTNEAYCRHPQQVQLYKDEVDAFFEQWGKSLEELGKKVVTDMGGTVTTDANGDVKLGGALSEEAIEAEADKLQQMADSGQIGDLLKEVATKFDPVMGGIPGAAGLAAGKDDTAPPSLEAYLALYNLNVYNRKSAAWMQYWPKVIRRQTSLLTDLARRHSKHLQEFNQQEAAALEKLRNSNGSRKEEISLRLRYLRQRNTERESWYHDGLDQMVLEYRQRLRPNLEAMWADLVPHLRLFKADLSRDRRYQEVSTLAMTWASQSVGLVVAAADAPGAWEDPAELEAELQDAERAEIQQKEEDEAAARQQVDQDFAGAKTPRTLPNFDDASLERELGPLKVKITPDNIEVSGGVILQGSLNYNWKEATVKGYLGVGASFSTGDGPVGASATLGTGISLTVNTNTGKVSEIDWTGTAAASVNLGVINAGASYEASVMHGNTLTVDVTSTVGRETNLYHDSMTFGK